MVEPQPSSSDSIDPLILHAENVFAQRQARAFVIDRTLLGEPAWDIILCALIAEGRRVPCTVEFLSQKIGLTTPTLERWIKVMVERSVLERKNDAVLLSSRPQMAMRRHLKMQMDALITETSKQA